MHRHGWSVSDMEAMVPFELDILVAMLMEQLKAEAEEASREDP